MNLLINFCLALFVLVSLLMVLVILMQRPKSEGLGAAFGAGGIFFALTLALSILNAHKGTANSAFRRELMKSEGAPQSSPAPAAPQTSPSPVASAAPNSGAGVLPAGSAPPPTASPAASAKP